MKTPRSLFPIRCYSLFIVFHLIPNPISAVYLVFIRQRHTTVTRRKVSLLLCIYIQKIDKPNRACVYTGCRFYLHDTFYTNARALSYERRFIDGQENQTASLTIDCCSSSTSIYIYTCTCIHVYVHIHRAAFYLSEFRNRTAVAAHHERVEQRWENRGVCIGTEKKNGGIRSKVLHPCIIEITYTCMYVCIWK